MANSAVKNARWSATIRCQAGDGTQDPTIRCDARSIDLRESLSRKFLHLPCASTWPEILNMLVWQAHRSTNRTEIADGLSSTNYSGLKKTLADHSFRLVLVNFDDSHGTCAMNLPPQISLLAATPGTTLVISSRLGLRLNCDQNIDMEADTRVFETVHSYHCSNHDLSVLSAFAHIKGPKRLGLLVRSKYALLDVKRNLCSLATTILNDKTGQSITVVLDKSVWMNPERAADLMEELQEEVNEHLIGLSGGPGAEPDETCSVDYLLSDPEDPSVYGDMIREDIHIQEEMRS